jgi:hypothetical protein
MFFSQIPFENAGLPEQSSFDDRAEADRNTAL